MTENVPIADKETFQRAVNSTSTQIVFILLTVLQYQ